MAKIINILTVFSMGLLFLLAGPAESLKAKANPEIIKIQTKAPPVQIVKSDSIPVASKDSVPQRESFFPEKSLSLSFSHFTWGAEIGSSLDLTSNDLSTFDVDVVLGFKNSLFKLIGVGAGIHRSIHTGNNFIPVYFVFRSSFSKKPSLFFLNFQSGYSFNSIAGSGSFGDWTGALGIGINLKQTSVAKSYIVLSCAYQHINQSYLEQSPLSIEHVVFAKLMIGVNF